MLTTDFKCEGNHNMPLRNMTLWYEDYFELKVIKMQQTEREIFGCPPICLRAGHKFPFVKVSLFSSTPEQP